LKSLTLVTRKSAAVKGIQVAQVFIALYNSNNKHSAKAQVEEEQR
jgi:hypothetical protein